MRKSYELFVVLAICLSAVCAYGNTTVLPSSSVDGSEGNGFFTLAGPLTVQTLFPASSLNGLPAGAIITGLQFRVNNAGTAGNFSTDHLDLSLGPASSSTLDDSVAANQGPGTVQVRSGSYAVSFGDYPGGASPNAFGPVVSFNTPYVYSGGTLLLTLSEADSAGQLDFDAVTGTPGVDYGQSNTYNATTLNSGSGEYSPVIQLVYDVPEPATFAFLVLPFLCAARRRP